jgi:adenosylhomocysteine nucleosidase
MDVRSLGFALAETPFERIPRTLEFDAVFRELPEGLCGTADRFETGETEVPCDVVDMEAYAFAKVCFLEGAKFACAKYVTDGADHAAATDWESNLPRAASEFLRLYRELVP